MFNFNTDCLVRVSDDIVSENTEQSVSVRCKHWTGTGNASFARLRMSLGCLTEKLYEGLVLR